MLAKNATWKGTTYAINVAILFFLSPFIVHTLGVGAYGVWIVLMSIGGHLGSADLGARPAIVYYIARLHALDDHEAVNRYVNSALLTFATGATLTILLGALLLPFIGDWFSIPAEFGTSAQVALVLVVLSIAATLPLHAFSAALVACQKFGILSKIELVSTAVRAAAIVAVLKAGYGIVGMAWVHLAMALADISLKALFAFRLFPWLRFSPRSGRWLEVRGLLRYGGLNVLVVWANRLMFGMDAFVIGGALGVTAVGFFSIGSRLPEQLRVMVDTIASVLTPAVGEMDARGESNAVSRLIADSARTLVLATGPVLVFATIFGAPFLRIWMGEAYARDSAPVLTIVTVAAAAHIAAYPFVAMHRGTNRMGSLAVCSLIEGIANLGLSLLLVHRLGISGVALGTAIPAVIIRVLVVPWWFGRQYGVSLWRLLRSIWMLPGVCGVVAWVLLAHVVPSSAIGHWGDLALAAGATAVVFWGMAVAVGGVLTFARRSSTARVQGRAGSRS